MRCTARQPAPLKVPVCGMGAGSICRKRAIFPTTSCYNQKQSLGRTQTWNAKCDFLLRETVLPVLSPTNIRRARGKGLPYSNSEGGERAESARNGSGGTNSFRDTWNYEDEAATSTRAMLPVLHGKQPQSCLSKLELP